MPLHALTRRAILALCLGLLWPMSTAHADDWLTFGETAQRNGNNPDETVLNVRTAPGLHQLWSYALTGPILTQPTLATGVLVDDGTGTGNQVPVDLIFAADLNGAVSALDAGGGGIVWQNQLSSLPTACFDFPGGTVGVLGTPTIDKANNRLWVVAADGTLWALDLGTGDPLAGYPLQIIDPANQNGTTINYGSPTYSNGTLYVTTGSQCDFAPWHGQLIEVDVGTHSTDMPSVVARWFPDGAQGPDGGGIWGPGGVSAEADGSFVYAATGNAMTEPDNAFFADHLVKLDSALNPVAAFAPELPGEDVDFGATPLLYQPPGCPPLLVAMNKAGIVFVLDRDSMKPLQRLEITQTADVGGFIGVPVYDPAVNQIYFGNPQDDASGAYRHGLLAFKVIGDCTLSLAWQQTVGFNGPDIASENPVIPAVVAGGLVYYPTGAASSVYVFDSFGNYLWDSGQQIKGGIFTAPIVVNGMLIVADYSGNITAFGP